jgi:putative transcriptional regulator
VELLIVYKDVFKRLMDNGWSTYRLQKERKIGNGTIQRIKDGLSVSTETIDTICELCNCQPGDIIEFRKKKKEG